MFQDLRFAVRTLGKSRVLTLAAVLSLALGIGANTAIFSIVKAVFLSSLAVHEPSRLVAVYTTDTKNPGYLPTSYPNYTDYRDGNKVFSGLLAYGWVPLSLATGGPPEEVFGQIVTGNYFEVLGVEPALGRFFLPEEDETPGSHLVAVLSYGFWQRRFGSDRDVIGRTVTLNGSSFHILGVAPASFTGTDVGVAPALWVPMMTYEQTLPMADELFEERRSLLFGMIGRLRPEAGLEQAKASLQTIASRLEQTYPTTNEGRSIELMPLLRAAVHPNIRQGATVAAGGLMVVTGIVLLIACANVASLLLARAAVRRREVALRLCLGATRGRIFRQLLVESLVLAVLGGGLGLLIALWTPGAVRALLPPLPIPLALDFSPDLRVLSFTIAISLAAGLFFGLAPALQGSKLDQVGALKEGKTGLPAGRLALRKILVAGQVGLSLVALIAAGLFVRSLQQAQEIDPGFEARRLAVVTLKPQGKEEARARQLYDRLLERVRSLPGVQAATLAAFQPLGGGFNRTVLLEGAGSGEDGILVPTNAVERGYFETVGIPLVAGRSFHESDDETSPAVAIVNQTMAERFWPGRSPIGQRFRFFGSESPIEVVGVASNGKYVTLGEEPRSFVYLPFRQSYAEAMVLHVRATGNPAAVLETVRRAVQDLDRDLSLVNPAAVSELLDRSLWAPRMGASLLGGFGLLALFLTAVGLYGTIAYSVAQRTRDIGIRMALGATHRSILWLTLRQGMGLVAVGAAVGLLAGYAATRVTARLLYGISATDPVTFGSALGVLAAVALLAVLMPARRAAAVPPMEALRSE